MVMKLWPLLVLLACASCFESPSAKGPPEALQVVASAALVTRPDGPISDGADVIPASEEAILDKRLREVLDQKRTAFIVVTVNSLGDQDVAAFTNSLARQWKVGAARGGVVLLVAPNDRQMRIETSEEVRARLSDQQCAEIIARVLKPRFQGGDFAGGIAAAVEVIAFHL